MSIVKPVGAAVVGPIAVFAAMMVGASAAQAAPYIDDATISVDASSPCPGEFEVISGSGFAPGEQVVIDLQSEPIRLGTVTADSNGDFTLRVRVPDAEGDHVVTARGLTSGSIASTEVDIRDCDDDDDDDDDDGDDGDDGGFGGLPRTGAAVGGVGVAGIVLIGGGLAARRFRRRRNES